MSRRHNPDEPVRILRTANPAAAGATLQTVRRYFPSATVSRTDSDGSRRSAYVGKLGPERGEPGIIEHGRRVWVEPGAASVRIRVYRFADPRRDNTLDAMVLTEERVVEPSDLGAALAAVIAKHGGGDRTGNPANGISISKLIRAYPAETAAIGFNAANPYAPAHTRALQRFADLLLSKLEAAYRKDGVVAFQPGSDIVHYSGFNPRSSDLDALVSETLQELAGDRTGNPVDRDALWADVEATAAKARKAQHDPRYATGHAQLDAAASAYIVSGAIWEFDGERTSPAELLADNPDNGDIAAAVKYLTAQIADLSGPGFAGVSFGGGAADEQILTVRMPSKGLDDLQRYVDAGMVTIPYAGDLPDAD
jgi:hypothetical protein